MIALNFSWDILWRIRYTDAALSFSRVKGLLLHLLCYTVPAKCNTILDIQTPALRPTHLATLRQGSATYGPRAGSGPPSKIIRLAAPLHNVVTVWPARWHFILGICSPCKFLHCIFMKCLWKTALCYKCTICRIPGLWTVKARSFNWLKFHKFPSFNNNISSKGNRILLDIISTARRILQSFWPATRERLPIPALGPSSDTHTVHVVLQSVQRFSEAVCRLQLNNGLRPFAVNMPSYPNPGCVVCSRFLCDWWLLPAFFSVA